MGAGRSQVAPEALLHGQQAAVEPMEVSEPGAVKRTRAAGRVKTPKVHPETIPRQPVIMDLEHGVVYGHVNAAETDANAAARSPRTQSNAQTDGEGERRSTNMCYHARITSTTEQGIIQTEPHKLIKVIRGPRRDGARKLHFVISKGKAESPLECNKPMLTAPQGKGYQWPESFKGSSTRHFLITFPEQQDSQTELDSLTQLDSPSDVNILSPDDEDSGSLRLGLRHRSTVGDVKSQLALHFIRSAQLLEIHFKGWDEPLSDTTVISDLADAASGTWESFTIHLAEL